ncbi:MAG TPA: hypothetical protein VG500_17700 [Gemmatimonadales bacterium]|jgi:hypothetical protein|nr:hypothetical protein [Gemmatimonadales bacterium]
MNRALRASLRRSVGLLLLLAAAGLTLGAPFHTRHDAADPVHQRACAVVAWTKAVQTAAVTPPLALALPSAGRGEAPVERRPSTPEISRPTPSARAPPTA